MFVVTFNTGSTSRTRQPQAQTTGLRLAVRNYSLATEVHFLAAVPPCLVPIEHKETKDYVVKKPGEVQAILIKLGKDRCASAKRSPAVVLERVFKPLQITFLKKKLLSRRIVYSIYYNSTLVLPDRVG